MGARSVTVLGAGSWGTALALHLARLGNLVVLWARSASLVDAIRAAGEHDLHPGIRFPDGLQASGDLVSACSGAEVVLFACPSHATRAVAEQVRPLLSGRPLVVSTAKGVEQESRQTVSAVLMEALGPTLAGRVSVLSGPSFAREVARDLPTVVTAAARELTVAEELQQLFNGPTFRVYTATDVVGVEVGGAVKNVIAIAAGVSDGLGFGSNARAALITRGLAEISRLGIRLGADRQTLYGLSCLGDLVLTCTGDLSRNRTVGLRLGRGERLGDIIASMREVAEGVRNTVSVLALAASVEVEMPITEQMDMVLHHDKEPRRAVTDLMSRRPRQEPE
ncbi:MAG TPA: NAD(P)H-dependent glycerol-3-phosphate dehydrogenase [Candidatus Binatia bacterium]|jgi:glycerol-3-phosphate dehydrogenase (NAD(P)+)|nr:NAD(P)H-dependent glycerol-3-phosphate dehydrogenase [Candidatus Binatia bacterium]